MDDLEERIFGTLADDTWFYPGHGKDSTLGAERPAPRGVARARLVIAMRHDLMGRVLLRSGQIGRTFPS